MSFYQKRKARCKGEQCRQIPATPERNKPGEKFINEKYPRVYFSKSKFMIKH